MGLGRCLPIGALLDLSSFAGARIDAGIVVVLPFYHLGVAGNWRASEYPWSFLRGRG
jgi:hypothetical protein